jgi:NADP-dependent 3-hydroxy acid dehydrogenase YdfG
MNSKNNNTIVFISGATSGIGLAVAEKFASEGYKLILTGRRAERLDAIKNQLFQKYNTAAQTLNFDVRDFDALTLAFNSLPEDWKNIDILINNAGLAKGRAPLHIGQLNHWETMIDTNIKGLLYLTRTITPGMVDRKKGFIINIGSIAGKEAYPDGNVYCATKAAVDMLTKTLRMDFYKYGIRVSAVHPGHVETEFALVRFDGDEQKANIYENFSPLRAEDVADTVYYVASRPEHVVIQDITMFCAQQASATMVDMSGKK